MRKATKNEKNQPHKPKYANTGYFLFLLLDTHTHIDTSKISFVDVYKRYKIFIAYCEVC